MMADTVFFDVFKNKTVFLTGHTGFIGSWLTIWLKSIGSNVVGYSLDPPTNPSLFESTKIEHDITHILGDVRDYELLFNSIKKFKPDFIFHLAAQPIVRTSYLEPVETIQTNIMGSLNGAVSTRDCRHFEVAR